MSNQPNTEMTIRLVDGPDAGIAITSKTLQAVGEINTAIGKLLSALAVELSRSDVQVQDEIPVVGVPSKEFLDRQFQLLKSAEIPEVCEPVAEPVARNPESVR